jgi:hypothetical protein
MAAGSPQGSRHAHQKEADCRKIALARWLVLSDVRLYKRLAHDFASAKTLLLNARHPARCIAKSGSRHAA